MMLSDVRFLDVLLSGYSYTAAKYVEDDGSVILSLNELDLVENAESLDAVLKALFESVLEYCIDFYNEFNLWASAPNKKKEIPYVFKALILDDIEKIKECMKCQDGKS